MVDHTGARLAQPDSTVKRPERQVAGHASAHGPANDAPGVEVEHDGQVQPALCRPDIADVGSPFLVGCLGGEVDPSRKSGGALHRLHCFCLEFDGACEVQRRVPTDWIIEPVDVSGYGSFSLAS